MQKLRVMNLSLIQQQKVLAHLLDYYYQGDS